MPGTLTQPMYACVEPPQPRRRAHSWTHYHRTSNHQNANTRPVRVSLAHPPGRADCSIAESTQKWLSLQIPVVNEQLEERLRRRIDAAISVYGMAANLLHPVYRGQLVTQDIQYNRQLEEFFHQFLNKDGLGELRQYREGEGNFTDLFEANYKSAITFWRLAKNFYPQLSSLALQLNNICSSIGQLERLFSEWGHVHSTKRNKLTATRSSKLISLYYKMRINDDAVIEYILNDLNEED